MPDTPKVSNNSAASQFEVRTDAGVALLRYVAHPGTLDLVHTEVPTAHEGEGVGAALARTALEYARSHALEVIPSCPFVAAYIKKHPEFADLVSTG